MSQSTRQSHGLSLLCSYPVICGGCLTPPSRARSRGTERRGRQPPHITTQKRKVVRASAFGRRTNQLLDYNCIDSRRSKVELVAKDAAAEKWQRVKQFTTWEVPRAGAEPLPRPPGRSKRASRRSKTPKKRRRLSETGVDAGGKPMVPLILRERALRRSGKESALLHRSAHA